MFLDMEDFGPSVQDQQYDKSSQNEQQGDFPSSDQIILKNSESKNLSDNNPLQQPHFIDISKLELNIPSSKQEIKEQSSLDNIRIKRLEQQKIIQKETLNNGITKNNNFQYSIDNFSTQKSDVLITYPILDIASKQKVQPCIANDMVFDIQLQNTRLVMVELDEIIDVKQAIQDNDLESKYPKPIKNIEIIDPRIFMSSPGPTGGMIQCKIFRDTSGMNHFHPDYEIHLSNQIQFLMKASKKANMNQSYYLISMHPQVSDRQSSFYLGKLRGMKSNVEFVMYDHGENSKSQNMIRPLRKEIGAVIFQKGTKESNKPGQKIIILPTLNCVNQGNLLERYHKNDFTDLSIYHSNPAVWNEQYGAHVLNFYGRVQKQSIKNFQLINKEDSSAKIFLQFGKFNDTQFNLDFQYPLTPLQAFMIALSSFEFKQQV